MNSWLNAERRVMTTGRESISARQYARRRSNSDLSICLSVWPVARGSRFMTNDDDCMRVHWCYVTAHALRRHRKSTTMPSPRHSILLISSQNTQHLTYVRRKWPDRLSDLASGDRKACRPAAARSGELYKSRGGNDCSQFRLASRIYCRLVSGWDRRALLGRINVG